MPDVTLKTGRTAPAINVTLYNPDGSVADLSEGTLRFKVYHPNSRLLLDKPATILNPVLGTARYTPAATDFRRRGLFRFEFVFLPTAGGSIPYPSDRHWILEVLASG